MQAVNNLSEVPFLYFDPFLPKRMNKPDTHPFINK
jgi:hypothetical protein